MYKVLIYSEDPIVGNGISFLIFWEKIGYTVVAVCNNEKELIKNVREHEPDLMIVEYDTLQGDKESSIRKMKRLAPRSEVVTVGVILGRNYVKKIVACGVLDHINRREFTPKKLIGKLGYYQEILSEKRENALEENHRVKKDILLAAQSQILKELLYGKRHAVELNKEVLKHYNIHFSYNRYVVMQTQIHESGGGVDRISTVRFFQEIVEEGRVVYICNSSMNQLSFICNYRVDQNEDEKDLVKEIGLKVLSVVRRFYNLSPNLYISPSFDKLGYISDAYVNCMETSKSNRSVSPYPLIFCEELKEQMEIGKTLDLEIYIEQLDEGLYEIDLTKIKLVISNMINKMHGTRYVSLGHIKYVLSVVIYKVNRHMDHLSLTPELIWGLGIDPGQRLEQLESKQSFIEWMELLLDRLIAALSGYQKSNRYITKMKNYVKNHYMEEITMKMVATEIGLTTSYMSTLFKKKTGETYKDYLINYRLTKAKILLLETTFPISTISERIGYDNEHYFSKVFKQKIGMTPSYYRKNNHLTQNTSR